MSKMGFLSLDTSKSDNNAEITIRSVGHRALKKKLQRLHQEYDRRENLGGLSVMKTWGLASIPNEGLVCACISTHAGDMPEYIIPSYEKCTVVFASDTSEDQLDTFPWQGIPVVWDVSSTQKAILEAISDYAQIANSMPSEFSSRIQGAAKAAADFLGHEESNDRATMFDEACTICDAVIPFESLNEASCLRGHQCSMSPFPFPSPSLTGTSKI